MGRGLRDWMARALAPLTRIDPESHGGKLLAGVLTAPGDAPRRGTAAWLGTFSVHPSMFAVGNRVSHDFASAVWTAHRPRRAGGRRDYASGAHIKQAVAAGELVPDPEHPILGVLTSANDLLTGLESLAVSELCRSLAGEAYWLLARRPLQAPFDTPVGYLPIPPHWILGTPSQENPSFRVSFRGWQGQIPAREIIAFRRLDPLNPFGRGVGLGQALADEIESDEMAAKHAAGFYRNSARPDIIVSPKDGNIRRSETERLSEDWHNATAGFWRAWRSYFLSRAVDVKELQPIDMRRGRYIELRQFNREQIFTAWGVPEDMFLVKSGTTRATIQGHRAIYVQNCLVPILESYRSTLQARLASQWAEVPILDYVPPSADDADLQLEWAKAFPSAVRVDEARERMGLAPLLGTAGQAFATGRARSKSVRKNDDDPASDEDEPAATRLAGRHERGYIRAQEASWLALSSGANETALTSAIGASDADAAINAFGGESAIRAAYADTLITQAVPVFLAGAELASRRLPPATVRREPIAIDLAGMNPEATRWAEAHAAQRVTRIGAEARDAIRTIIALSNEQGIAPREVARRIVDGNYIGLLPKQANALMKLRAELVRDGVAAETTARRVARFAAASLRKRAMLIVRTELIEAVNAGQQALWQQAKQRGILPAGTKRVWLVTLDDALEEDCAALDGVQVEIDEPFPGGIMHPPLHPACRCSMGIVSVA